MVKTVVSAEVLLTYKSKFSIILNVKVYRFYVDFTDFLGIMNSYERIFAMKWEVENAG